LSRGEMLRGPGGENEQLALLVMQLERVPGEIGDLVTSQRNDGLARRLESGAESVALRGVLDQVEPDESKLRSDTQHDVGVIDQSSVIARALKGERVILEIGAEFFERLAVSPPGKGDVSQALNMIEYQASGAFEIKPAFFIRRIVDYFGDAVEFPQASDEIEAALGAAGGSKHRVERD